MPSRRATPQPHRPPPSNVEMLCKSISRHRRRRRRRQAAASQPYILLFGIDYMLPTAVYPLVVVAAIHLPTLHCLYLR